MTVVSSAYYVPSAKARLLSPQRLFCAKRGVTGRFVVTKHNSTLLFDGVGELQIDYDSGNHLPTCLAKNHTPGQAEITPKVHLAGVLSEGNTNLSPAGKLILHWHCCFGHNIIPRVHGLFRAAPFSSENS